MRILKDNLCSKNNDLRVTLDTIHQKQLHLFKNKKKNLPKLKKKLILINKDLEKILNKSKKVLNDDEIKKKFSLQEEKKKLEIEIKNIDLEKDLNDYYLNIGDSLFQYYDKKKNPKIIKKNSKINKNKNKTVIDFFTGNTEQDKKSNEIKSTDTKSNDSEEYKGNMKYMSKKHILNRYLNYVDSNYVTNFSRNDYDICSDCSIEMTIIHSDGVILCENCGKQTSILINSDKPSYKDPPREMSYFAYKRIMICAEKHCAAMIWALIVVKHLCSQLILLDNQMLVFNTISI